MHGDDAERNANEPAAVLDARGLRCPLPVLKLRKRLLGVPPGAVLEMRADDTAALIDVPHFCAEQGHDLVDQTDGKDADGGLILTFLVRRGPERRT